MPTNLRFEQKFADSIVAVLGCHDRVIFRGHLPFGGDQQLNLWVDHGLKMRRMDFLPFVEKQSNALVAHAQQAAQAAQAPYQYLQGQHSKEKIIERQIRERCLSEGLVAVLCCLETCRSVRLLYGAKRPALAFRRRPQRVLYYYFLDPTFGLVYVRLQTWFPFTIQVYVNGHEWLARQMLRHNLGFVQQDNAFVQLDEPAKAQTLAERFSKLAWVKILDDWAQRFNTLLDQAWLGRRYYWVIDQAEYSTDLLFHSRAQLAELYPKLLDHAVLNFSAEDILTFLGRRLHACFDGEVLTLCKKDRQRGARVKHRVKNNWLKMYDKFGQILRIETVINQPREFKVRRWRRRQGQRQLVWCPMNKGVANFYHYHAVARAANQRYLDALAVVDRPCATAQQLDRISAPVRYRQRRRRGLNLLAAAEQQLFLAVLQGQHRLHGVRNRDLAAYLFATPANDEAEQRRRTAQLSRRLALLRAHGLIAKIPHSQRYRITQRGEALMSTAVYVRYKMFPNELTLAEAA